MNNNHINLTPDIFLSELILDTDRQFGQSPIYQKQLRLGKQWKYSICATPILKGKGIMFGINWGGDGDFQAQTTMPSGQDITDYHFIKQSRAFLENQWGLSFTSVNFNYTNLCFFRTPRERYLIQKDYELSLPLFKKYVTYINPPWLLSIGVTNLKILKRLDLLTNVKEHLDDEGKFRGYSGQLWNWNIFSVPHPSARMTSNSRMKIWNKVTSEMRKVDK